MIIYKILLYYFMLIIYSWIIFCKYISPIYVHLLHWLLWIINQSWNLKSERVLKLVQYLKSISKSKSYFKIFLEFLDYCLFFYSQFENFSWLKSVMWSVPGQGPLLISFKSGIPRFRSQNLSILAFLLVAFVTHQSSLLQATTG